MAWPTLEEDENNALGRAPPVLLLALGSGFGIGLQAQDIGQADAEHPGAADAQKLTTAETVTGAARFSRYRYHNLILSLVAAHYRLNKNDGLFKSAQARSWAVSRRGPALEKSMAFISTSVAGRFKQA